MRLCAVVLFAVVSLSFAPAPLPKRPREVDDREKVAQLYASVGGLWIAGDTGSALTFLWLHKGEKAIESKGGSAWRLSLTFHESPDERYHAAPARVAAEGNALKFVLQPAKGDERHGIREVLISRTGDGVSVRVIGGAAAGTYSLQKARSKQ